MNRGQIEQIDALAKKATAGPWKTDFKLIGDLLMSYQVGNSTTGPGETVSVASARTVDHEFITTLVNAWPQLRDLAMSALDDRKDAERLRYLGDEPFCDEYGGVDLHEQASKHATANGREEPNSDDYLAAVRDAIDSAMKPTP